MAELKGHERRKDARIPISAVVNYRFNTFSEFSAEHASNLSLGGMFIRAVKPPPLGSLVFLQFVLQNGTGLIEGVAEVVRVVEEDGSEPRGFGVKFRELSPESRNVIRGVCERAASDQEA